MKEMHVNPSTDQALVMTYAKSASGGIQDMRTIASAAIVVRGPNGSTETTYPAVISSQTAAGLVLTHTFVAGEFAATGVYTAWGLFTPNTGTPIQGEPQDFRVKERWERLTA
jgi:hypothetical protein